MKRNRAGRPVSCRNVREMPKVTCFGPEGMCQGEQESVMLTVDELEAIRLADREGCYQSEAAVRMNVSRQTFGRILESAHRKVAEAIVEGKRLCIEGGVVRQECDTLPDFRPDVCFCPECGHELPHVKGVPCRESHCPLCNFPLQRKGGCGSELNQQYL
ncbi:MAG: DUF134 domain-containing protein [Chlorobiaceae bacterium]|nr:DUF134 domain-containing protein [Chlorobiaceae bacterium]NTV61622.1 DUF134 domain-containing protein [Chlorobiaceae bacterium]